MPGALRGKMKGWIPKMKKLFALLLAAVLLLTLFVGCKKTDKNDKTDASGSTDANAAKLSLVVAGRFGDRSFYDSSKEGAERLQKEGLVQLSTIECNGENFSAQMQNAADKANIVVCVGWEFYDVATIAPQYPNVKFIWIDNATDAPVANVLNITYAQNEGSYLAGYIAAAMSKNHVVGAVGGEDSDTINDFIVGYKQGAAEYDAKNGATTTVLVNYTNSYDDPAIGKECAIALNDKGADVIFQIASAAGDGVFDAAAEKGFYAIGVDSDQKYISPDTIICSMKKEVGNSIYDAVKEFVSGNTSKLGTTWQTTLAEGYVGIGYGEDGSVQQIPDEVKQAVEEYAQKIGSGEIKVDTTRR